jgi:hypothetical protein
VIALLTFPIAGVLAALHHAWIGPSVGLGLTVWTAWFLAVLLAAGADAVRTREPGLIPVWGVMAAGWVASMLAWKFSADPLIDLTIKNLTTFAALILISLLWESVRLPSLVMAGLHGVIVLTAFLAYKGVIPVGLPRPRPLIGWSYTDIATGLQYASLIVLGGWGTFKGALLGWRDRARHLALRARGPRVAREAQERVNRP